MAETQCPAWSRCSLSFCPLGPNHHLLHRRRRCCSPPHFCLVVSPKTCPLGLNLLSLEQPGLPGSAARLPGSALTCVTDLSFPLACSPGLSHSANNLHALPAHRRGGGLQEERRRRGQSDPGGCGAALRLGWAPASPSLQLLLQVFPTLLFIFHIQSENKHYLQPLSALSFSPSQKTLIHKSLSSSERPSKQRSSPSP